MNENGVGNVQATTAVVGIQGDTWGQLEVDVGLGQGNAFSPLLYIRVVDLICEEISEQEEMKKILYIDDLRKRNYIKHCKNGEHFQ